MMFAVKLAVLCVALVSLFGVQVRASPVESKQQESAKVTQQAQPANTGAGNPEPLQFGNDGSLFLSGNECGPDEQLAPGMLPCCEPTCGRPKPFCPKMFFSGVDYVPCFCKAPLVRNEQTKQCVQPSECPPLKSLREQAREERQ